MLLNNDEIIKVTNRDSGRVGYRIPEMGNLHRVFASGESKEITMGELRKLVWQPGGQNIIRKYLLLNNNDAIQELLGEVEPEYFYKEEDIKTLLTQGSLDELMDCLDFAPDGTNNLVKKVAVETELNDIQKRDAILKSTGFNVTNAININHQTEEEVEESTEGKSRRVAKANPTSENTGRRTSKKYNVVSIKE